jgi:membrane associated rhomboid family serine protease
MLVVGSYVISLSLGYERTLADYAFIPAFAIETWRWITHIFLHANVPVELAPFSVHLLWNIAFLYWLGDNVEDYLSRIKLSVGNLNVYAGLFLIWGVVAAAVQAFYVGWGSTVLMVGASGAISGVLGFYLVKFPKNKVWVADKGPIPAFTFLVVWFLSQFGGGDAGVAYFAHIGGFIAGAVSGILIKAEGNGSSEMASGEG